MYTGKQDHISDFVETALCACGIYIFNTTVPNSMQAGHAQQHLKVSWGLVNCLKAISEACIPLWQLQTVQQVYALCCSTHQGHIRFCRHLSTICMVLMSNVCTMPYGTGTLGLGLGLAHWDNATLLCDQMLQICLLTSRLQQCILLVNKQHFQTCKHWQHNQTQTHHQRKGLESRGKSSSRSHVLGQ